MQSQQQKEGRLKKARKWVGSKVAGQSFEKDVQEMWERLKQESRLVPVLNRTDLQMRLGEIQKIQAKIRQKMGAVDQETKAQLVDEVYNLFFSAGDPWYRGLFNRELAKKVSSFLWLYNDVRDLKNWLGDLFMCAQQLLSLSWQEMDVTNTPWLIVESPVLMARPPPGLGMGDFETIGNEGKRGREESE